MKKIELLNDYTPRGNNVVVRLTVNNVTDSGIIIPDEARDHRTNVYDIIKVGPLVPDDLSIGDVVILANGALSELDVEDAEKNEIYHYCPETFVKLVKHGNTSK